jgi:hypothetical protein
MKKVFVIIATILVLILVIAHFIPSYSQKEILVISPIMHPAQELNSPAEWQRWNPVVKKYCLKNPSACPLNNNRIQTSFVIQAGQNSFAVVARGVSYDITETNNGAAKLYNYTLVPSIHNDSTMLVVTVKTNMLSSFLSFGKKDAFVYADSLKSFIETPSAYYGFPIQLSPVIDSNVITTHKVVLNKNPAGELKFLYKSLDSFIEVNHLKTVQPHIAHFQPKGNDSVDVMVGVPVDRMPVNDNARNGISFMKMPVQGHIVIGYYKGKYKDRIYLYRSMDRYFNDKLLKPAAVNYEKYLNNNIPENDSSMVEINLCAPYL